MVTLFGRVDSVMARVGTVLLILSGVLLLVISTWILLSIASRFIPGFQIVGTAEVAALSVVALTFLCVPYAMRKNGHIRTTVIAERLPPIAQRVITLVGYLLGALVFMLIVYAAWEPMLKSWASGEFSGEGSLRVPTAPLRTILVVSAIFMVIECVLAMFRSVVETESVKGERHE